MLILSQHPSCLLSDGLPVCDTVPPFCLLEKAWAGTEKREGNKRKKGRGEMKPKRGAFRAALNTKTLALRLETCSFPFRKLLPLQGFAGWVSQGLCCYSQNPSAPDVPCGQMYEAKVLIPWVAMSGQQYEDAADLLGCNKQIASFGHFCC